MKQVLSFEQMKHLQELGLYHTYTLQDILDKLPCFIGKEVLTIQKLADSYTCLYMEPYSRSMIKIMQHTICCAGVLKTDMLKLERRNNYGKSF